MEFFLAGRGHPIKFHQVNHISYFSFPLTNELYIWTIKSSYVFIIDNNFPFS